MGGFGSAEKVLSVHTPAKIAVAPLQAVARGGVVRAARLPQQAGPSKRAAKFAALPAKAKLKAKAKARLFLSSRCVFLLSELFFLEFCERPS